ncbi:MAG: UvrD-helicase domain-containing protein, partial [Treponema sp.]|nr:UvrD-helicase domain-containing protein [Treponema sp.]
MSPAYLERWARIKGIGLLGTGDCTHPQWLSELREQLDDAEPGLFVLKDSVRTVFDSGPALVEELPRPADSVPRFVLSGEISTIYKRGGKTRKVHHVILLSGFKAAAAFQMRLERIGNIRSDGRPILGLDSRDLLSLLLEADAEAMLIPAHIWTPWFSALGAQSGFDTIEECYGDLVSFIPAIETGLSSDPPMNWALSALDRFSIISNSDAHSPDKLGREATVFDMELSWPSLHNAMRNGVIATVEFFPEEGKYHCDGHRKCGVCIGPQETHAHRNEIAANGTISCPVCGKPLTRGVMGRVQELADRPLQNFPVTGEALKETNRRPFHSLIPLREMLGELLGTGPASKKVSVAYSGLIEKAGSEFSLLMDMSAGEIAALKVQGLSGELLAEAIGRMRRGEVSISPGYDGEYGVVKVFPQKQKPPAHTHATGVAAAQVTKRSKASVQRQEKVFSFDSAQEAIINYTGKRAIIIAGPGTGKTAVLAAHIARIINNGADAASILALSFTVKAASELRERIRGLSGSDVMAATFHSFCCTLLREQAGKAGLPHDFEIIGEARREELLRELCKHKKLGNYIEERKRFLLLPGEDRPKIARAIFDSLGDMALIPRPEPEMEALYSQYRSRLRENNLLDYDDLIAGAARLLCAEETICAEYQRRFRYIFVDEYQDINLSQYVLLRLLAGDPTSALWVIGDPNQAIYGFRGSDKRFIDRFTEDFPDACRFELVRSFRCAAPIISAAGQIAGSDLRGTDRPVDLYRCEYATDKAEAEGAACAISRLIGGTSFFAKDSDDQDSGSTDYADTAAPGDCAILIRAAALAGPLAKALSDHGIPFDFSGEQNWWDEEPFRSFLERVRNSAAPEDEFRKEKENPALKRLFDLAVFFGGIHPLLDALAYSSPAGLPEIRREGVSIMTIHASKGLEFDHVFIIGLEDGILPFT